MEQIVSVLRPFTLADGDLEEFRRVFKSGTPLSRLLEDHEEFRFWSILRVYPSTLSQVVLCDSLCFLPTS